MDPDTYTFYLVMKDIEEAVKKAEADKRSAEPNHSSAGESAKKPATNKDKHEQPQGPTMKLPALLMTEMKPADRRMIYSQQRASTDAANYKKLANAHFTAKETKFSNSEDNHEEENTMDRLLGP